MSKPNKQAALSVVREKADASASAVDKEIAPVGTHYHVLDRQLATTQIDGAHLHAYRLPSGEIIYTAEGGGHQHTIDESMLGCHEAPSVWGGAHKHELRLADGSIVTTQLDGYHHHELQVETTGIDGGHVHAITLPDGSTILSLTSQQLWMLAEARADGHTAARHELTMDLVIDDVGPAIELSALGKTWRVQAVNECRGGDVAKRFSPLGSREFVRMVDTKLPARAVATKSNGTRIRVAAAKFEPGIVRDNLLELWVAEGPLAGAVTIARAHATGELHTAADGQTSREFAVFSINRRAVPCVFDGSVEPRESGLPADIAKMIPEPLRWWDVTGDAAILRRDTVRRAMPDMSIRPSSGGFVLTRDVVRTEVVDAIEPRSWTLDFADALPLGRTIVSPFEKADWRAALATADENAIAVLDPPEPHLVSPRDLVDAARTAPCDVILAHDDRTATKVFRELGHTVKVMRLRTCDASIGDRVFASTVELRAGAFELVNASTKTIVEPEFVIATRAPAADKVAARPSEAESLKRVIDTIKAARYLDDVSKSTREERFVYGIVLQPEQAGPDAQNDVISPEEIRQAAHRFMEDYRNIGLQHQVFVNDKVAILENFIAPVDFKVGDETVFKDSWLMGWRIRDDELWKMYRDGDLTGFSIGGTAIREPVS